MNEITTLDKGYYSGLEESFSIVIDSEDHFQKLWTQHTSIFFPPESSPVNMVNFDSEMVAWISLGMKNSGGYDVEIVNYVEETDEFIIICLESMPGPEDMVTEALTQPYHIVKMKKSDKTVRFDIRDEEVTGSYNTSKSKKKSMKQSKTKSKKMEKKY